MTGEQIVGTRHIWRNSQEPLLNYLYDKAFVYVAETQVYHHYHYYHHYHNYHNYHHCYNSRTINLVGRKVPDE